MTQMPFANPALNIPLLMRMRGQLNPPPEQQFTESNLAYGLRNEVANMFTPPPIARGMQQAGQTAWNWPGQQVIAGGRALAQGINQDINYAVDSRARQQQRQQAAAAVAARPPANPFATARVTSDMSAHQRRNSSGADFAMPQGTPITLPVPVRVLNVTTSPRGGNIVEVQAPDGTRHKVMHNSRVLAQPGQTIPAGTPFALSGGARGTPGAGNSTGPHAHVQSYGPDNSRLDPVQYFKNTVQQVAQQFGIRPPGFDASGFDNFVNQSRQATDLLKQPFETTFDEAPRPQMAPLEEFQAPDFARGDAAFEATRPKNPFEEDPKKELKVLRQNYFRGMAQALASINFGSGTGLGELLAKVGGGALAGRMIGEEKVDQMRDEFEQKMAEFNRALANREDGKAQSLSQTLNANISARNQRNLQLHQENIQEWQRNLPGVELGPDGSLVLRTRTVGENGQVTERRVPFGPALDAAQRMREGTVGVQRMQMQNQYNWMVTDHLRQEQSRAIGIAGQIALQQGQRGTADDAMMLTLSLRANALAESGAWERVPGARPDTINYIKQQAAAHAGIRLDNKGEPMMPPTPDQERARLRFIEQELLVRGMRNPEVFFSPQADAAFESARARGMTERTSVNARGQTSTSQQVRY